MFDVHSVDLVWWGDALIEAGAMSAALYGLWRVWLRPIVQWFQLQGLLHVQVAQIVITELPKISLTLVEHEARLTDVERALRGAAIIPEPPIPMTPYYGDVQERLRRFSRIPGPLEPDLPREHP